MFYKEKLKAIRERIGVTQSTIAKMLEVDRRAYSHYENENTLMPIKHLNSVCNYFNVSLDFIFGFTEVKNKDNLRKDIDKKLSGKRLKELRKMNKITQAKLAEVLNTTQSTIAEYERGTNIIATPFLYTICKNYEISADYLLGKSD